MRGCGCVRACVVAWVCASVCVPLCVCVRACVPECVSGVCVCGVGWGVGVDVVWHFTFAGFGLLLSWYGAGLS